MEVSWQAQKCNWGSTMTKTLMSAVIDIDLQEWITRYARSAIANESNGSRTQDSSSMRFMTSSEHEACAFRFVTPTLSNWKWQHISAYFQLTIKGVVTRLSKLYANKTKWNFEKFAWQSWVYLHNFHGLSKLPNPLRAKWSKEHAYCNVQVVAWRMWRLFSFLWDCRRTNDSFWLFLIHEVVLQNGAYFISWHFAKINDLLVFPVLSSFPVKYKSL